MQILGWHILASFITKLQREILSDFVVCWNWTLLTFELLKYAYFVLICQNKTQESGILFSQFYLKLWNKIALKDVNSCQPMILPI